MNMSTNKTYGNLQLGSLPIFPVYPLHLYCSCIELVVGLGFLTFGSSLIESEIEPGQAVAYTSWHSLFGVSHSVPVQLLEVSLDPSKP